MKRIADEPAFVLHRYDWSESSLILDLFTRHFGRIAVVARGVKKPSSSFRPVLLPMQPLHVAFGGDAEIRTLKSAEWLGGQVMPSGDQLLSGYYLNELLLRLLARDDPHPALFDAYAATVRVLAGEGTEHALQPALRAFELLLLREIGLLPTLDLQTLTLAPLADDQRYSLRPEGGLVENFDPDSRGSLTGAQWRALQAALDDPAPFNATLQLAAHAGELKTQLRALLHYHCGVATLRTRQLMIDLQAL
ncbi:DNA repair protein RecO [Ramlibacter sp. G-1-2-2]|uniref:DNA repair protein RecO n=1 Tax=Ramlibacter agri TaxID=2728837 RepID=A0A848HEC8_9BURK|nr:DNA repair protein RecO [Ramlibacter agri]NML46893.1 DNA repair protein RecO [Ramlibacter agri]